MEKRDNILRKKNRFPKWIEVLWLNNRRALAPSLTVWKFKWKQRGKHWSVPHVCVVFSPGQLLSEHWIFSQREAAVQVRRVQESPCTGWFLSGHLHSLRMGWENLKFPFGMSEISHFRSSPSSQTFVSLKCWNQSRDCLAALFYFFLTCFYSLKIYFFKGLLLSTTHITGIHIFPPLAFSSAKPHFKFSVH